MSFSRISSSFTSAVHQTRKRRSPQRTSMKMKRRRRRTRLHERCCHVVSFYIGGANQTCDYNSLDTLYSPAQDKIISSVQICDNNNKNTFPYTNTMNAKHQAHLTYYTSFITVTCKYVRLYY